MKDEKSQRKPPDPSRLSWCNLFYHQDCPLSRALAHRVCPKNGWRKREGKNDDSPAILVEETKQCQPQPRSNRLPCLSSFCSPARFGHAFSSCQSLVWNDESQLVSGKIRNCYHEDKVMALDLWPEDQELSFQQAVDNSTHLQGMVPTHLLRPLDQTTNLSSEQFTDIFGEQLPSQCLETPVEIWPSNFE